MSIKCELFNDHFQNWKSHLIQKAQLIITDKDFRITEFLNFCTTVWGIDMMNRREKRVQRTPGACPKCGSGLQRGGVRFGRYVEEFWRCLACGLTSDQESYYDARFGVRRPVRK